MPWTAVSALLGMAQLADGFTHDQYQCDGLKESKGYVKDTRMRSKATVTEGLVDEGVDRCLLLDYRSLLLWLIVASTSTRVPGGLSNLH